MKLIALAILCATLTAQATDVFLTDSDKALAQARKEKKPLLISFYGIWCPPCNELDETVFETAPFLEKAKSFVLLKVDADAKSSWKLKDRYKVGGYPTIVFTNPTGKEIYRIVGYRVAREFLKVMDLVLQSKGKTLESVCKSKDPEDLWRCATLCSERKEPCAVAAFHQLEGKLPIGSSRYLLAKSYFAENAATADLKRLEYERLLTEFPQSPMAMLWAGSYLELFEGGERSPPPKRNLVEAVLRGTSGGEWLKKNTPVLEEIGLTESDLAQARGDLWEKLGGKEESTKAWKEAAVLLEKAGAALPSGAPVRGFTIERISCLAQAGEVADALKLAEEYAAKFPNEFTFHFQRASLLNRVQRYPEALSAALRAFSVSYGDNKIRAATLLIALYGTVPDKEAAKKVRDQVTAEFKPDATLQVRTHRYLKKLDEAWQKLDSGRSG